MLATFSAALQVKKRMAKRVLKMSGVHGIGVGYRDPAHPKRGAAVIVYTDRLASASTGLLSATALGKKTNVPVRIVKTGKIRANATDYKVRIRPVIAGYSVGTIEGSGSTGLIVAPTGAPATRYLLAITMSSIPPIQTIERLQFSQAEPMGDGCPGSYRTALSLRTLESHRNEPD